MNTLEDEGEEEIISTVLECLSLLASTCVGEKIAKELNLLNAVMKYLFDEVGWYKNLSFIDEAFNLTCTFPTWYGLNMFIQLVRFVK